MVDSKISSLISLQLYMAILRAEETFREENHDVSDVASYWFCGNAFTKNYFSFRKISLKPNLPWRAFAGVVFLVNFS